MSLLKRLLLMISSGGAFKIVPPSANVYFDDIGSIWLQEQAGYSDGNTGTGYISIDTPPSQQGAYFDRV